MARSDASSPGNLWDRIRSARVSPAEQGDRHRGTIVAICLLMSAFLWFTFSMQETYTATFSFPVVVVDLPAEEALTGLPPSALQIQVSGEGADLLQLYFNRPAIRLSAQADEIDLDVLAPDLTKNVRFESVTPRRFAFAKEERVTRMVPIIPRVTIDTPPTHDLLGPPRLSPDSVVVSGARSILEGLNGWPTRRAQYTDLRDTLRTRLALVDTLAGLVARNLNHTTMTIVAAQFTQGVREIEVRVEGAPTNERLVTLEPETIRVVYNVLFDQFEASQRATDFFATVSYDYLRADTTGRVRPRVHLPDGVVLRDVTHYPPTLRYYNFLIE